MIGPFINSVGIVTGSLAGVSLGRGLSQGYRDKIFNVFSCITLGIGVFMVAKGHGFVIGQARILGAEHDGHLAAAGKGLAHPLGRLFRADHPRAPASEPGRGAVDRLGSGHGLGEGVAAPECIQHQSPLARGQGPGPVQVEVDRIDHRQAVYAHVGAGSGRRADVFRKLGPKKDDGEVVEHVGVLG